MFYTRKIYTFGIAVLCTALVFLSCEDAGSSSSAPAVPANFAAQAGKAQVVLTWTASEDTSVTGYKIRQTVGGTTTEIDVSDRATATYTVTGLTNGQSYSFTIAAVAGSTESAQSTAVTVVPVLAVPAGFAATLGNTQVVLAWTASEDSSVTGYKIRQTLSGTTTDIDVSGMTTATHTVTSLTNGQSYSFTIAAVAGSTESAQSTAVTAAPLGMSHAASVADSATVALTYAPAVDSFVHNSTQYIVTGSSRSRFESVIQGISVFSFNGTALTHVVTQQASNTIPSLYDMDALKTFVHNSTTYIVVGGFVRSGGLPSFSVLSFNGTALTHVATVEDTDAYAMKYITELTVFTHGNSTYIAATGNHDDGFSVFSFDGSALTHVATVKDTDNDDYALLGLYSIHSFVQGGTTYLAAGSVSDVQDSNNVDRGFTVFSFDGTALTHTVTVRLDRAKSYLLWIPWQLTSFVHGENTYLAVADYGYSGLGIYNFDGGTISHAATVLERDNPDLYALDRSVAVTKFEHRGNTYLVVGGQSSGDGINLFGFDGSTLHHVQTIVDSDNPVYELNDVSDVTSFVYNGSPYIAVSAHTDHGMSVFKVE